MAKDYIFNKFGLTYFTPSTIELNNLITNIQKDIEHRPLISQSKSYKKHLENTLGKVNKFSLDKRFTDLNISLLEEHNILKSRIDLLK
jgi:hypothetical protein